MICLLSLNHLIYVFISINNLFPTCFLSPLFVTLKKAHRSGELSLRGCIGNLSPIPLSKLYEYALSSAFRDSRFSPLKKKELPSIVVSVSLLVQYEECEHPFGLCTFRFCELYVRFFINDEWLHSQYDYFPFFPC